MDNFWGRSFSVDREVLYTPRKELLSSASIVLRLLSSRKPVYTMRGACRLPHRRSLALTTAVILCGDIFNERN